MRRDPNYAKTELLDAATRLFARLGFENTSMAAIGEEAGVSRGLPAYFFRNKRTLYSAVLARATEQVRQSVLPTIHAQAPGAGIEQIVKYIVDAYLDFLNANPEAVRLLQWESLNPAKTREKDPLALFDEAVGLVEKSLKKSAYTRVNARFLLLSIAGMCFFPFGVAESFRRKPALLRAYKKHVMKLVLNGIRGLQ